MNDVTNLGLWYTKEYFNIVVKNYKDTGTLSSKGWNEKNVKEVLFENYKDFQKQINTFVFKDEFKLKTIYPGLACGLGYKHELGVTNEFKLGLYFDYTTGLPVIPGSSIKGVLKHAFEDTENIIKLLTLKDKFSKLEAKDINKLKDDIFDGIKFKDQSLKGLYSRDCFLDAEIYESLQEKQEELKKHIFLADDYITCHQNYEIPKMTSFTEPNPVKFLKVRSNVIFQFKFRLCDSEMDNLTLTPQDKIDLFKRILLELGVGAKTNVGYGQFDKLTNQDEEDIKKFSIDMITEKF